MPRTTPSPGTVMRERSIGAMAGSVDSAPVAGSHATGRTGGSSRALLFTTMCRPVASIGIRSGVAGGGKTRRETSRGVADVEHDDGAERRD